ncbi:MAG: hypothetical protein CVV29_00325 [Methanobacteriales archaeon HGW-Methanobacteriales-2]|nr:MAG: hypothetical protein CVV29_00325 [Methanobacteriales archaeon HGW-Methanobacteriales-2]
MPNSSKIKLSKTNLYLICILLVILGLIGLLLNAKELFNFPGLILFSIILMIAPGIFIVLNNKYEYGQIQSLILIIIPIIFVNYIISIKMGLPTGYQDTHSHIYQFYQIFNESGKILFENSQKASFNFVGLYILYMALLKIINVNLASVVPFFSPLLNLFQILCVYLIGEKLFTTKISLLTMLFFGWNYQVILFGNDMRTQTLGVLLLFLFLFFVILFKQRKNNEISKNTVLIIILFSIVLSSFVSIIYTSLLITGIILASIIFSRYYKWETEKYEFITFGTFLLFWVFFIFYLIYIGISFDSVVMSVYNLFIESLFETGPHTLPSGPSGQLYGNFVFYYQRIIYILFFIFSIIFVKDLYKEKNFTVTVIFIGLFSLFLYFLFSSITGLLSAARMYILVFILIAFVLSYGLINLKRLFKKRKITNFLIYVIVILYVLSNVVSFPSYIIGETAPLRSEEGIDGVYYWDSNLPQYTAVNFLNLTKNKKLRLDMEITNYLLLLTAREKNLTLLFYYNPKIKINNNDLIILHDKFKGSNFYNRNKFQNIDDYENNNKIYTNFDYIVFQYRNESSDSIF